MEPPLSLFAKLVLLGAGGLAVVAGPILYLFPHDTPTYFAWPIANPLTPVYMGASYLAGVGNFVALRANRWSVARVQLPAILVFAITMLLATLLHLPIFNWTHPIAWAWLAVYLVSPCAAAILWVQTERAYRPPAPSGLMLPAWFGPVMLTAAIISGVVGLALFVAPSVVAPWWPWSLTALTARVIGGWFLGAAALQGMLARQPSLETARVGLLATVIVTVLLLIGALWQRDSLIGPLLAISSYLLYQFALLAVAFIAWFEALRRPSGAMEQQQ